MHSEDNPLVSIPISRAAELRAKRDPYWSYFSVRKLIDEALSPLDAQFLAQDIARVIDVPVGLQISADYQLLRHAIHNLLLNAVDATPRRGEITITAYAGRYGVEIEVSDNGPGLSEETRRRAFDPTYSTKGAGTGLGLATVARIAKAHGGDVVAANCPEGGAAFTLRIPQRLAEAAA